MDSEMRCINCNYKVDGNYCQNCGQKAEVERITTKSLFSQYIGRIFGFDTKFLRTVKHLTISPGIVAQTFIGGNRVRYIDPIGYFVIITTLFLLSFALLGVDITDYMMSASSDFSTLGTDASERQRAFQEKYISFISNNMRLFGFLVIPFFGLVAMWFYRKSNYNYLEHLTNVLYLQGHTAFLNIIAVILFKITSVVVSAYMLPFALLYFTWGTLKFYKKNGFGQWIKGIVFYLFSFTLFMISFILLALAVLLAYIKWINPNYLN